MRKTKKVLTEINLSGPVMRLCHLEIH